MSSPRRPGADAPARLADVETLRRLTRDAFAEITSVRDRLRDLERSVATERASRAADRARVDTRVEVSTASPALGRRDARRRDSRVRATTTVETPFDNGDALFVRFATRAADGRGATSLFSSAPGEGEKLNVALDKLAYRRRCGPDAWVRLVLVGAEGHDAAATLSPTSKGASLSGLGAKGAAALAGCRGAAVCASVDAPDGVAGVAAGVFSGDLSVRGAARPRAMAQATVRPGSRAAASLAVAVLSAAARDGPGDAPAFPVCVSAQGLLALGDRALVAAWASGGFGDDGAAPGQNPFFPDWGVVATAPPTETSPGWGLALGRGRRDGSGTGGDDAGTTGLAPLRGEAFLRLGGGFSNQRTIIPGIVFTRDEDARSWDATVACKVQFDVAS
jgi:hypothetical protein